MTNIPPTVPAARGPNPLRFPGRHPNQAPHPERHA